MKYTIGRFDVDITKHDEKVTLTIGGATFRTYYEDVCTSHEEIVWQLENVHCIYFSDDTGIAELELTRPTGITLRYIGSREPRRKVHDHELGDVLKLLQERNAYLI